MRILKKMLGQVLMESGLVSIEDINTALETQKATGQKLGEVLIAMGVLTREQLTRALEFDKGNG
jgi:type IV pilus assembly protein PilB